MNKRMRSLTSLHYLVDEAFNIMVDLIGDESKCFCQESMNWLGENCPSCEARNWINKYKERISWEDYAKSKNK